MKLLLHGINISRFGQPVMWWLASTHKGLCLGVGALLSSHRTGLALSVVLSYIQRPVYADAARLKCPFLPWQLTFTVTRSQAWARFSPQACFVCLLRYLVFNELLTLRNWKISYEIPYCQWTWISAGQSGLLGTNPFSVPHAGPSRSPWPFSTDAQQDLPGPTLHYVTLSTWFLFTDPLLPLM